MAMAVLAYGECRHIASTVKHQNFYLNVLTDFVVFVNLNTAGKA
jgi:hypothetical protein